MKLIYVAGPFRGKTHWEVEQNIRRAEELGLEVAKIGCAPVIPHAQTRFFDGLLPDEFWLESTLLQMSRCDGVILVPDWERSSGTRKEVERATVLLMPLFTELSSLKTATSWSRFSSLTMNGVDRWPDRGPTLDDKAPVPSVGASFRSEYGTHVIVSIRNDGAIFSRVGVDDGLPWELSPKYWAEQWEAGKFTDYGAP